MPPIPPVSDAEAPEAVRKAFDAMRARSGAVPNLWRQMAHAPEVLLAAQAVGEATRRGLPARLRELAYLRTSQLNACEY